MKTKATTVRLPIELLDEIDEACEKDAICRNDFIKDAIENQLELEASSKNEVETVSHEDKKPYFDSLGNRFYWNYDKNTWVCELNPKNMKIVSD